MDGGLADPLLSFFSVPELLSELNMLCMLLADMLTSFVPSLRQGSWTALGL